VILVPQGGDLGLSGSDDIVERRGLFLELRVLRFRVGAVTRRRTKRKTESQHDDTSFEAVEAKEKCQRRTKNSHQRSQLSLLSFPLSPFGLQLSLDPLNLELQLLLLLLDFGPQRTELLLLGRELGLDGSQLLGRRRRSLGVVGLERVEIGLGC